MYQGCNKTALCSLDTIAEGFYELLKEKEYAKITASEICKKSGVSRQTYYSLFSSKESIVSFILSKEYLFDPSEECQCSGQPTLEELSRGFSAFIIQKADFIELLEKNNIIYLMQDSLYDSFSSCTQAVVTSEPSDHLLPCALTSRFIAAGLTAIARYYVCNRTDISVNDLEDMIFLLFSGEYL